MVEAIPTDLLKVIETVLSENIEEYKIEIVVNEKGQGFASEIVFLTLVHQKTEEKYQLIAKQDIKVSEEMGEQFSLLYTNEINFYQTIWPFMQEFYKNASGKQLQILPKCFGTSSIGRKLIIMENLRPLGFKLYDKQKAFDDDHFRKILVSYGIFHAVSMALREKDFEQYNRCVTTQTNVLKHFFKGENKFTRSIMDRFREAQEYFDCVTEKYVIDKLRLYEDSGVDLIYRCMSEDFPKGVIVHGDCWSNNLMFRYDEEGKLQDVKMLDFQAVCHSTPIWDLSYCIYSGASEDCLNNLDDFLKIYHGSLSDTLNEFGLSSETLYSFETLKEDWKKYCKIGFTLGLLVWKVKLAENIPDFSQDLNAPVKLSDVTKEAHKKKVRELVFHMYNNNFL